MSRQPLKTRGPPHCNLLNDLRLLLQICAGGIPPAIDHRIMLDVEFVLSLPYSANPLPFRNKDRLVEYPSPLVLGLLCPRGNCTRSVLLMGRAAPEIFNASPDLVRLKVIMHSTPDP